MVRGWTKTKNMARNKTGSTAMMRQRREKKPQIKYTRDLRGRYTEIKYLEIIKNWI